MYNCTVTFSEKRRSHKDKSPQTVNLFLYHFLLIAIRKEIPTTCYSCAITVHSTFQRFNECSNNEFSYLRLRPREFDSRQTTLMFYGPLGIIYIYDVAMWQMLQVLDTWRVINGLLRIMERVICVYTFSTAFNGKHENKYYR